MKLFKYFLIGVWVLADITILKAEDHVKYSHEQKTIKILTIGNSFARNACQFLPEITGSVSGCEIIITTANIGGCSLEKHVNLIEKCAKNPDLKPYYEKYCLKELLAMDNYGFITIQQVSLLSFKPESFQPYADKLINFIKQYSPDSEIIIHQTWAYSPKCKRLKDWNMSREEMHDGLVRSYNILAEQYNLEILPSGNAFYSSFDKNKDIYLWAGDGYHANNNGCYLAGCVWFGKFFNISPEKVKFIPDGMNKKTAIFLRKIAAKEINK